MMKFLMVRKDYMKRLNKTLSSMDTKFEFLDGMIYIIKMSTCHVKDWKAKCIYSVKRFFNSFQKASFPFEDETRELMIEPLTTIQNEVSSSGAACWLDDGKLILVGNTIEFDVNAKKVANFVQMIRLSIKKCFSFDECTRESIVKELPQLQKKMKSCKISLNEKQLVVVCPGSNVGDVLKTVDSFLECRRLRSPLFVKVNVDVHALKFVMNRPSFLCEFTAKLNNHRAKFQEWIEGESYVKIVQQSKSVRAINWTKKCRDTTNNFFNQFQTQCFAVETDAKNTVSKDVEDMMESIRSDHIDCWFVQDEREIVLVGLKNNFDCVAKLVEKILTSAVEENKKSKQSVEFFCVASPDQTDFFEKKQFLTKIKETIPGLVEVTVKESRTEICLIGSEDAISTAKQQLEDLMKSVAVLDCTEIPNEVVNFVSQKAGLEYIDTLLSNRNVTCVISVIAKDRLKIVGRSIEECSNLKSCLCEKIIKVSVHLPDENEHIFFSSQWHEILKSLEAESLVEYKVESDKSLRRSLNIFGVKELVEKYAKKLKDLMHSLKIVCNKMVLAPSISRFMKEVMESEIHALEADFKNENVKIEIRDCESEIKGTEQGIVKVQAKFEELKSKIVFELKEFFSLGLGKLLSSENGKLILKGIETENNVVIEILNDFGSSADVMNFTRETADLVDNEPFNVCNFKTTEGINVSWKYGNIERERVRVNLCVFKFILIQHV